MPFWWIHYVSIWAIQYGTQSTVLLPLNSRKKWTDNKTQGLEM